jgi:ribonuclease HII
MSGVCSAHRGADPACPLCNVDLVQDGNTVTGDRLVSWTIGSDEAGYGTWAGSLVVAATALPDSWVDRKVKDSKKLQESARRAITAKYVNWVPWAVQQVTAEEIDARGVWNCLIEAHATVQNKLRAQLLEAGIDGCRITQVIDGLENAHRLGELCTGQVTRMAKADDKVLAVSLASCLAKTGQVDIMDELHKQHPQYRFNDHRGYGTPAHKEALAKLGPLKGVHRFSYSSIAALV